MRHISHDRFYYFISQLLVGSTCLYQYLSVCLTIKCYGFNTLQYITSLVNESSWRNLNKGGEHRLTVMNQLDKMDLQGPLHKELEKIQIFKDRLIHSLLTSSQMHQVYMTGQTFLEGRGVLYGPDPSPNIWAITPRGGGKQGADQGVGAWTSSGWRAELHTPRGTPGPRFKSFELYRVFWSFVLLLFLYGFQEGKLKDSKLSAAVCFSLSL